MSIEARAKNGALASVNRPVSDIAECTYLVGKNTDAHPTNLVTTGRNVASDGSRRNLSNLGSDGARTNIVIETAPADSGLQATVESLLNDRPDLMDPKRLQLFERILNSQIESRMSSRQHVDSGRVKTAERPPNKFTAAVIYLCGGYFTVMSVALPFPKIPTAILPVLAIVGFFSTRYWVRRSDSSFARKPE